MSGKVIPLDTRKRIVDAYNRGKHAPEIADVFGVSVREVYRLVKQEKETGELEPRTHERGRKPKMTSEQVAAVCACIREEPDITLRSIIEKLDLPVCISELSRIVRKCGFRLKKKVMHASEQERPRCS